MTMQSVSKPKQRLTEILIELEKRKEALEISHGVRIQDDALILAIHIAFRYFKRDERGVQTRAFELVEKACVELSYKIETNAEEVELDLNEYVLRRSLVELHELKREKLIPSECWTSRVEKELKDAEDKWNIFRRKMEPLVMLRHRSKTRAGEIYMLEKVRQGLVSCLQEAETKSYTAPFIPCILFSGVVRQLDALVTHLQQMIPEIYYQNRTVGPNQIAEVASPLTGVPASCLSLTRNERMKNLRERLRNRVIGQDHAIDAVLDVLQKPKRDLEESPWSLRNAGSLLFLGSSGMGKTELAKALAQELFHDEDRLIRIDMSEYMEPDSVSRLFGVPSSRPDGHEEPCLGYLTEAVERRPHCIVLLDKVDKAHPSVTDVLLQILRRDRLKYGHREFIFFDQTLIIMTSNVGVDQLSCKCPAKCSCSDQLLRVARRVFNREMLELLDKIVVFNRLNQKDLKAIASLQLRDVTSVMNQRGVIFYPSEAALEMLIAKAFKVNEKDGKSIKRRTKEKFANPLIKELDNFVINDNCTIYIDRVVGTSEFSLRVVDSGDSVEDQILKQLKQSADELRILYRKEKERVNMIYTLRRKHIEFITSLCKADLVSVSEFVQDLVNIMNDLMKNTTHTNSISDEDKLLALSSLAEEAEIIQRNLAKKSMQELAMRLRGRLVDQHRVVGVLAVALLKSIDGHQNLPHQPAGSFLLLGLTNAGKMELVEALNEYFVTDNGVNLLMQINLSECGDSDSLFRPFDGLAGNTSHEGGQHLLEVVRRMPYSILLFDQVEKAHPSVFSALLSLLDRGTLIDNQGRVTDFRNTIFIITSNLGIKGILAQLIGRSSKVHLQDNDIQEVRMRFRSELLNRVDEILLFNPSLRLQPQLQKFARLPMTAGPYLEMVRDCFIILGLPEYF